MKPNRVSQSIVPRTRLSPANRGRWLSFSVLTLGSVIVAVSVWHTGLRKDAPENSSQSRVVYFPVPAVTSSPFQNTQPDVRYVGTQRCVECHSDQHASYLLTAHSRSMSQLDPRREPPDAVVDHAASGRRYRVYRQDGQLRHRESLLLADTREMELCDYPLTYLIGSGRFARTYLVEDAGFLVESPLTWYASLEKWAMSPGYDRPAHRSFHRTIEHDCLFCHAGSVEPIQHNEQFLRLNETALSCERCHGPGSLHVARWSADSEKVGPAGDQTIVNPKRLSRDLADAVCHQCHLTGEVQVAVRGRRLSDFRPGLRWQDFAIDYGYKTASTDMTVVGHVAQMRQSRCYQASGTLTCITCHDAHAPVEPTERIAHYRTTCLRCHAEPSCGVALTERAARNGNNCVACHMPQSPTDIPHIAFTHHRVGIHDEAAELKASLSGAIRPLVPILDVAHLPEIDRRRALGLAYIQYSRDHDGEGTSRLYLAEAQPLIEATVAEGMIDACLALAQAEIAAAAGDLSAAERWARRTLSADDLSTKEKISALRLLAGFALQQDRVTEAASYLNELTALCRDPRDWLLLGVCRQRQGNASAAISAFERVLEIDPAQPETYEILAPLYRAQGQPEREEWCREQARLIRQSRRAAAER